MNIHTALLATRKDRGYKQKEVSKMCDITQTYLSQIETGAKKPSMDVIEKLAHFYAVPLAIMMWRAVEDKDIPKSKLEMFRAIKPSVDNLINSCF